MSGFQKFITSQTPVGWEIRPLWALFRRQKRTGYADEELLSVYREYGVIPKSSRDDNHNKESDDLSGYQLVTEGSLVTNKMKAWQGSIAISRYRGIVSPAYYVYEPLSEECDQFLHYLLRSEPYIALYGRISKGVRVNQWDLEHDALRNVPIMLPDLETQKAIAAFLDRETARIDQLIEKRHTFLALLEEKERSIAAQAVNGALIASERNGECGWFGTIPSGWGLLRGKFLFRERQDKSETGNEELLSVSHLTGVTKRSEKDVNMFLAESMEGYKLVSPSDVVVNTMWAWMGAMGVSDTEGLISPSYGVYAQTASSYDPAYLDLLLRSKPFVAEVNRRSKGVWSSRLRLYPDAFLDIRFPVPPRADQERILAVLERELGKERKLASLSRTSIDRLREYRSALITAAVTGQIDVTTWGKRGETDRRLNEIEREMAS